MVEPRLGVGPQEKIFEAGKPSEGETQVCPEGAHHLCYNQGVCVMEEEGSEMWQKIQIKGIPGRSGLNAMSNDTREGKVVS